jgi:hypothetical protein
MIRTLVACALAAGIWTQPAWGAKAMFYDPGRLGTWGVNKSPGSRLRPIDFARPFFHCGIHYWLENESGTAFTENAARDRPGRFTLHLRNNIGGGWLTVWDVDGAGRELTPKEGRYSGYLMSQHEYVVPGVFQFGGGNSAKRLVIVWARSQTEVAHSADDARKRVKQMSGLKRDGVLLYNILRETDESTPGEVGTYVVNSECGGVFVDLVLRGR